MFVDDVALLACPETHSPLRYEGTNLELKLQDGVLICEETGTAWYVEETWPRLYKDRPLVGKKKLLQRLYEELPRLHDPLVRYTLPLFQQSGSEAELRRAAIARLELEQLKPGKDGVVRILEVGVGTGANLPYLLEALPEGLRLELWGCDLSLGMLKLCRQRCEGQPLLKDTRLLMADALALPFRDQVFDRVFHVGGIGGMASPKAALAEMLRVARPGSPLVVVDEQLDGARSPSAWQRLTFKAITFYDDAPAAPIDALPPSVREKKVEQLSPFYYGLSFRAP
jgi:ubiquinone/menaquinone biosynthesis C-methylase UbiE/uncharacterized protein YbaR (Trm112 family)